MAMFMMPVSALDVAGIERKLLQVLHGEYRLLPVPVPPDPGDDHCQEEESGPGREGGKEQRQVTLWQHM